MLSWQQWFAIILLILFVCIFTCGVEAAIWQESYKNKKEYIFLSPATLKRYTKMNWVGCTLTWMGIGVISPLMFIYKFIYNLFHI